jgi:hypothetical protein
MHQHQIVGAVTLALCLADAAPAYGATFSSMRACIASGVGYCRHHRGVWHNGSAAEVRQPPHSPRRHPAPGEDKKPEKLAPSKGPKLGSIPKKRPPADFDPNPYGDPAWTEEPKRGAAEPLEPPRSFHDRAGDAFQQLGQ